MRTAAARTDAGGSWRRVVVRWVAALAAGWALTAACAGCAGLGMTGEQVELLDAAAADARFVDRSWAALTESERREFVGENAWRWEYFSAMAHGRRPAERK
jgi:hypothetical protein